MGTCDFFGHHYLCDAYASGECVASIMILIIFIFAWLAMPYIVASIDHE